MRQQMANKKTGKQVIPCLPVYASAYLPFDARLPHGIQPLPQLDPALIRGVADFVEEGLSA